MARTFQTARAPAQKRYIPWPPGRAFQRLHTELTLLREDRAEQAAEVARLEAALAEAREVAERDEQGRRPRELALEAELEELGPQLGYNFDLPEDANLAICGRLGKARCRAAQACRNLRAAVCRAKHLFKHRLVAVAAGGNQTAVCTGDQVFTFGGEYGAEGPPWGVVTALLPQDVVAVAISSISTLMCTAEGQVYSSEGHTFELVDGLEEVVGVAVGYAHMMAWTRSGELYTWGTGTEGQLGHDCEENEEAPRLVDGLEDEQVVGADGGDNHSVACTASGRVYTWGTGTDGELGHGQEAAAQAQLTPRLVQSLEVHVGRVASVAAGGCMTAVVTDAGELCAWGYLAHGALGHGGDQFAPFLIDSNEQRVAGVAIGEAHMLAWTDKGELYSCGDGAHGKLGLGYRQNCPEPCRVRFRKDQYGKVVVIGVACGHSHTVVMTQDHKVYTFGRGDEGQLGHGNGGMYWGMEGSVPRMVTGLGR